MKLLLAIIAALAIAVGLTRVVQQDAGVAVLSWGEYSIETSLAVVLGAIVAGFLLLYLVIRLLLWVWHLPRCIRNAREQRRARRARNELVSGELLLAEGKWDSAEKRLMKNVDGSQTPLLHYLFAAKAAQLQGAHQRRDHYLRLGFHSAPEASTAVALTQAEMQLEHQQTEQAVATLRLLQQSAPKHHQVLKLLARAYETQGEWNELHQLLPQLQKQRVYTKEGVEELTRRVEYQRLSATHSRTILEEQWKALPKTWQLDTVLLDAYVDRLVALNEQEHAENVLTKALQHHWDDSLIERYGLLNVTDLNGMITRAEGWLKIRPQNAVLLLALGRLCLKDRLWGKARAYLEASIKAAPTAEAYRLLGQLLERLNESAAAGQCYRQGLEFSAATPAIPLPEKILPATRNSDNTDQA